MHNFYAVLYIGIFIGAGLAIWAVWAIARSGKDWLHEDSEDHME